MGCFWLNLRKYIYPEKGASKAGEKRKRKQKKHQMLPCNGNECKRKK